MEMVFMTPRLNRHVEEDEFERYSMGAATEPESEQIEQHLLVCQACRNRLQEGEIFIQAMRGAAVDLQHEQPQPRRSFWLRPFPAFATAVLALLMVFAGVRLFWNPTTQTPVAVALHATRGTGIEAHVPAGQPLVLKLDVATLEARPSYRVEIVDQGGRQVWSGTAARKDSTLSVGNSGLRAGIYFVRVFTAEDRLLREYGLEVRG
jgi:hypothetical protein